MKPMMRSPGTGVQQRENLMRQLSMPSTRTPCTALVCCAPVPGDPIVGFITRGQGVSIHRADCPNYLNSLCKREQEGRWLNVSWADKTMGLYTTTLRILARDRNGLILDIAAVLNALNAKVRSLNARSLPEGNALVYVTTEVPDLASLRLIMARIRTLGGVREIERGNG